MNVRARSYINQFGFSHSSLIEHPDSNHWFDQCGFALITHTYFKHQEKAPNISPNVSSSKASSNDHHKIVDTLKGADVFSFGAINKDTLQHLYQTHINTLGDGFTPTASIHSLGAHDYLCLSFRPAHSLQGAYLGVFRLASLLQGDHNRLTAQNVDFAIAQVVALTQQSIYAYAFELKTGHCQKQKLSHLEQQTIQLLAHGVGIQDIATDHIHRSRESINKYIAAAKRKLGATSLSQLVSRAILLGII